MKTIFVILRSGISGGTATLSIRIGECLIKKGCEVIYICQEYNDLNNVKTMNDKGIKVYRWKLNEIEYNLSVLCKKCNYRFLTYSLEEFLFVEKLKKRLPIVKNSLYVVQHYALTKGSNENKIIRKSLKFFYRKVIKRLVENNTTIFMDDNSVEVTEKYYGFSIKSKENIVFLLPINLQDFKSIKVKKKSEFKTFNMLTIARAEFPFKGYIVGLIDDFKKLCDTYNDITLTIITFGKDEEKIVQKINKLPSTVQSKITLIGQTPYENLNNYFDATHLYLGMGTTLLDAVNNSVPALVVQQYTYNNYSSGFFHMQPNILVAYPDVKTSAAAFIESVKQMNNHEYELLCKKEHDTLLEFYNIDLLINWLQQGENEDNQEVITKTELTIHQFIIKTLSVIKRYRNS